MAFELPPLPYPKDALAPHMSAETLDFHHDKHHRAYVTTLNKLIEGSPSAHASLEDIVRKSAKDETMATIFSNAAQTWNHIVACDVWEHAYYIDYRNRRGDVVRVFLDHLINWEFVPATSSSKSARKRPSQQSRRGAECFTAMASG